jgi:hypothetical protein
MEQSRFVKSHNRQKSGETPIRTPAFSDNVTPFLRDQTEPAGDWESYFPDSAQKLAFKKVVQLSYDAKDAFCQGETTHDAGDFYR